ncbi:pyrimidine reductase family protein [Nocardia harenae]|uniref:pyrimidine reductase family protein n=1 Tax=Nocardia harenae TaxID=358707 RepID=UPI000A000AA7|nr:pyrimidine reductase family protein [Nocardia harenae]
MVVRRLESPARAPDLDDLALRELYGYPPELTRPYVRVNFVSSVDGAITDGETVSSLATPADKALFFALRAVADAVLVGAATVRAENYGPADGDDEVQRWRAAHGLAPIPPVVVVSGSAGIEPDARLVTAARVAPVLVTAATADPGRVAALERAGVRVVRSAGPEVTSAELLAALTGLGLLRVLCEGGPTLLGQLLGDDAVDELCVTTSPLALGGRASRIAHSPTATRRPLRRGHMLADDDGTLMVQWIRDRS